MLVYNTNPEEGALEMTGPNMDIPVPSAMISFNDSRVLKQALSRTSNGVLRIYTRPQDQKDRSAPADTKMVVDIDALAQNLKEFFSSQYDCNGEACLNVVNSGE